MKIHETLKTLRAAHGYSQEQLAEKMGVSRQAIAKWEGGAALPELDKLVQLSALFQVTLDQLVRGECPCAPLGAKPLKTAPDTGAMVAFLLRAGAATYAGKGRESPAHSRPGSHDFLFEEGDYRYIDTYLGGARFIGEEALYVKDACVWGMNYCGRTLGEGFSGDFLHAALLMRPADAPYRGPRLYRDGRFTYHNAVEGDFSWFTGHEEIFCDERLVYELRYHGGLVSD